jgi:hypothetical protein
MKYKEILEGYSSNKEYFHASEIKLKRGTILRPAKKCQFPERKLGPAILYLEKYKPDNKLGHTNGVFMCDNYDTIVAKIIYGYNTSEY